MNVELLEIEADEVALGGIRIQEAFDRGCAAVRDRVTAGHPSARPYSDAGLRELVDLYAEAMADMQLLRFGFATDEVMYARSRNRYDGIEEMLGHLRHVVAPRLRARLRELRARETELEHELSRQGVDPDSIGPRVPDDRAIGTDPRPAESPRPPRALPPLAPRPRLLDRVRTRLRRQR